MKGETRAAGAVAAAPDLVAVFSRSVRSGGASEIETLQRLFERMPAIYFIVDAESQITFATGGGLDLIDRRPGQIVGKPFFEVIGMPAHTDRFLAAFEMALAGTAAHVEATAFGRYYEAFLEPSRGPTGAVEGVHTLAVDQTDSRAVGRALRRSDASVSRAQRLAGLGSWVHYPASHETLVSDEMRRLFDFPEPLAPSSEAFLERMHPDDRHVIISSLRRAERDRKSVTGLDFRILRPDGAVRWARQEVEVVCNRAGDVTEICGTVLDITDRKLLEEHLRQLAHFDVLTGLANRLSLGEQLARMLAANERTGQAMALLFVDVDRFKTVNDTLGHSAGDVLLQAISKRISQCLRAHDFFARVGGDEFVILLSPLDAPEDAARLARRIGETCSAPFRVNDRELFSSVSIGISTTSPGAATPGEMLRDADAAMYAAKAAGRSGFAFYDPSMHALAAEALVLENDLRRAIERDELVMHYQPIVNADGTLATLEALVRWNHPTRGLLAPDVFISIAEESGIIVALGEWVLRAACRDLRLFRQLAPELRLAVNLSARQFDDPELLATFTAVLFAEKLDFSALEFEITESVVMTDIERALTTLGALKASGARVSIDDFGTGYSSLGSLKRLPLDTLKIDKSFIADLPADSGDVAIVRAILAIGQALDLCIVAEGVETQEQLEYLRSIGCGAMQGYYIGRPVKRSAIAELLLTSPALPDAH